MDKRVLVAYASKSGGTAGIAERSARCYAGRGCRPMC